MNNRVMNSRNPSRVLPLLVFLPMAVGCGDDKEFKSATPFAKADDIRIWATTASAVAVYAHAYEPIGVSDGAVSYQDPACPETSDDGATFTIRGGCTDASGHTWSGQATVTRDGDDRLLTLDGLVGTDQAVKNGTVRLTLMGPSLREFEANLELGEVTTIDYLGTVEGDYTTRTVWNGEGHVEREGVLPPVGAVDATTVDEVVDNDVCAGQPVSGTTTLRTHDHTAVIVYDGATDCDADEKARVFVNDEDRGLIGGIVCTVTEVGTKGAPAVPALFFLLAGVAARLRRWRPA